ncbi:MAG: arsenite efflux transporter metallochaperone ArsD [Chitinophagaceae bacterium]|nr:arsenite efflux transporter metallochaperone ArsD [Chitinophagaceae bacterium]
MKITILDPAMCCSTGVCGTEVDDALVQTAANVKWLKALGHDVHRHGIANDAAAFQQYPEAIARLQKEGTDSLPYILVEDKMVMTKSYPTKAQWEQLLSLRPETSSSMKEFAIVPAINEVGGKCCGDSGCC